MLLTNEKWVAKLFSLVHMVTPSGIICALTRQFESCKTMYDALSSLTSPRLSRSIVRNAFRQLVISYINPGQIEHWYPYYSPS